MTLAQMQDVSHCANSEYGLRFICVDKWPHSLARGDNRAMAQTWALAVARHIMTVLPTDKREMRQVLKLVNKWAIEDQPEERRERLTANLRRGAFARRATEGLSGASLKGPAHSRPKSSGRPR